MAKESTRWTDEARAQQRERFKTQNPTAQGVAARKAQRHHFDPSALAQALGMLTTGTT
jgi:hypothetical protein